MVTKKGETPSLPAPAAVAEPQAAFIEDVRAILRQARSKAYAATNAIMVDAYWRAGQRIVQEEQGGKDRADYGSFLIRNLSRQLGDEFGHGVSIANLKNFRQFYLTFPEPGKSYALRSLLSWTHWRLVMRVENPVAREYYIRETAGQGWKTRQLERNIATQTYERILAHPSPVVPGATAVCMSRRICVEMYREISLLRPDWAGSDDEHGTMKVVMTGNPTDPLPFQDHIRSKQRREVLANRFRDPKDHFQIVIVRDMWLTGFDAPSLHTMYIDKPMRGHGLMQAIARVNRVFKDKPGGLVVDYLGLADELKKALATYTESGGTGKNAHNQEEAVGVMLEKYEICCGLFHGLDWTPWVTGSAQDRLSLLPAAQEVILGLDDGKNRCLHAVTQLSQAFALAVPHEEALRIRDDVGFFQAVRAVLSKNTPGEKKTDEELEHAIRQIISKAITSDAVVDIFTAAGLKKPDISILSDEFLADVQKMPQRNLAVELLRKLLTGEIRAKSKRNVVQGRSFAELLEQTVRRYQNRAIETAQVIEELIALAKTMKVAQARGEALGLNDDELAFYDALEVNDSAVKVLGEPTLTKIARELVAAVRKNVTIDWTVRETVRAQLRVIVKRILRKFGYPPDMQEKATLTVIEQAEVISEMWAMV
ncbi:MAG: type I restriction enzyme endonuclease domain-containing protein [Candidatus Ozemobacteraceae bacterium]